MIHRLADGVGRPDVIHEVCERSGKNWPEAERFVDGIASADQEQIARRAFPLLLAVSIGTVVGGVAIVGLVTAYLLSIAGRARTALAWAWVIAWLAANPSVLVLAGMGLAMIGGGLAGLVRAAEDL